MKLTITNYIIIICFIFTIYSFYDNSILLFGINNFLSLNGQHINTVILQFLLYSFLHGNIVHILFNSIFLYVFGNKIEEKLGKNIYLIYFIFGTIFIGIFLFFFTKENTIGISGFTMALLTYYTILLYEEKNDEYKGGITAIIVSILIGLSPEISLLGHLAGVIYAIFFYIIYKKIKF